MMNILSFKEPFEYMLVENFYDEQELQLIWKEIDFLSDKLLSHEETSPARDSEGKSLKKNKGLFLDDVYVNRDTSSILSLNRKLWCPELIESYEANSYWWSYVVECNRDRTLLNRYNTECYYKPHRDKAIFTAVTVLYKEPANFIGGDFTFSDYEITIPKQNNLVIIFPSVTNHSVEPVTMIQEGLENSERFSISQFIYISDIHP